MANPHKKNFLPIRKPPRLSAEQHKFGIKKVKKLKKSKK